MMRNTNNKKEIELLQTVIDYSDPNLENIIFTLVKFYQKYFFIYKILKLLKINRNTYYSWQRNKKQKEKTKITNSLIIERIGILCQKNYFSFGYRKITVLYQRVFKTNINHKLVLKIMKKNKWLMKWKQPNSKNKFYEEFSKKQPNLIKNNFKTNKPLTKLYTDLTCFANIKGHLWVSTIIDGYNNQVLASVISKNPNLELVKKTFKKIPKLKEPCIIHSDQGKVYQSIKFQSYLNNRGFLISMSRKATPNDNAAIESYYSNLKGFMKTQEPRLFLDSFDMINKKVKKFISFYNKNWLFAKLGYQSPLGYLKSLSN
ncbi:predicted transposase and inactivated derivatives ['Chrysanthemum coronarium' phytoplasma]|uniref:Predicted transposase and inactivated derivatives n=2 Tax='Chrysanthemum coronarium' phytoplasma TaxID=1520703 RepID=A0ABQ0J3F9_9MOLU|nr:predicted transposase and inactivated derivatives ['Chrysanthemum coronarium' phytoplasma]